jgi:hypothetical protein
MERFKAKLCLKWFDEQFNNHECFDFDDEICCIRFLLKSISDGEIVTCIPYSDELKNEVFLPNKDMFVPHNIKTYHEDIGFNRCLGVMVATGRMKKV